MATFDLRRGQARGQLYGQRSPVAQESALLDFAAQNYAQADVAQVFHVPAGSYILAIAIECTKAEGAALTVDVTDGGGILITGADLNALGITGADVGKFYAADNTISVSVSSIGGASAANAYVRVLMGFLGE